MTPQKVFQENAHFLLLPVILVGLKFLWEAVGPLLFATVLAAAYALFLLSRQYKQRQTETAAKKHEESADSLIAEVLKEEERKEQAKKVSSKRHVLGSLFFCVGCCSS